ncbi:hypothetical protein S7711_06282 [Stachybotrys chartarum IBT 7711]|uniref:methionyl-tRNA formyltransferase n=1 Tax=Stachybotrys chartarum (strain CBS 109288 / IBT 7711) TaxID=1280523 RepID=A0A084B829_STACB|nr:hypothetical protein S7711_06282 [Stachybotrys chartarum IBT 7711]
MFRPFARIATVPLRSPTAHRCASTSTRGKASDPLRILFCGSDDFSCESLRALQREHVGNPGLVQSLEVMVRPPKPTGRGNKKLSIVPCQQLASQLRLPIHELNTFRGWELPQGTNLVIAVSFGLFVPSRILGSAKYGGLNVHPSLLPDLRGPAPIHHALLRGDEYTGVSLQTLDSRAFDHGAVLAQTPSPGFAIGPSDTVADLVRSLGKVGADMLVQGLRDGVHVPPHHDVGWMAKQLEGKELTHAPKVNKSDSEIDWTGWTPEHVERRTRVFGALWTTAFSELKRTKRIILLDAEPVSLGDALGRKVTFRFVSGRTEDAGSAQHVRDGRVDTENDVVYVALGTGSWIRVQRVKIEGKPEQGAVAALQPFMTENED